MPYLGWVTGALNPVARGLLIAAAGLLVLSAFLPRAKVSEPLGVPAAEVAS